MADVIAAISTGKQPCAIGILRLSGEGCAETAGAVFHCKNGKPLSDAPDRKLVLGTLYDARGREIDQALAVYSRAPHSYTGEDTVELQCHGSPAVLAAGLEALCRAGARLALPGEFTKRAFLNGQMDLTGAEAVIDLIEAQTVDMAANAAAQVGGALDRKLLPIYEGLTDLCSHYHAVLDYTDEDIPDFRLSDYTDSLRAYRTELERLLATCERGRVLKQGVRIALVGKPNAGKSSLLNALVGFDRAIVTDVPGTTRDTVEETARFGRVLARITDTAGIRKTEDRIEAMGVERSRAAAEQADLAIFVCDGAIPLDEEDWQAMAAAKEAKNAIAVLNKTDLEPRVFRVQLPFDPIFAVSATRGDGLEQLCRWIEQRFGMELPCDGSILTNARQSEAVRRAAAAIDRALDAMQSGITPDAVLTDLEAAMEAMGELSGRTVREDITNRIFERFCVGK
ncbi:MAG: tRNA uridine-5-carboxymethylaminomethyl(34) synthesis GTPase MnmE [Oscillospiraceae bacterium]|nr:tRNA uridine-5-carboxymethylaminomethyl(34) synthesis GTPase MnmE [Oscillospiraceae bacterium]